MKNSRARSTRLTRSHSCSRNCGFDGRTDELKMSDRRNVSSSLSAQVINYLRARGHSQAKIARMLRVSEGFVSLVKSKERALTIDHLELLSQALAVPLGALLLAVTQRSKVRGEAKKLFELSEQIMRKADSTRRAILRGAASTAK